MEAFTNHWFKRRHTGTHSAQEAAERMSRWSMWFRPIRIGPKALSSG
jgi:hypothetical protein